MARATPVTRRRLPRGSRGWRASAAAGEDSHPCGCTDRAIFPNSLTTFLLRLFTGRIRASEIEAEAAAQIALLQGTGLRLTHIDTHKHAHMFPPVLRPVLRAARAAGIRAVRNPFEPEWAVRATNGAPLARMAQVAALRSLGRCPGESLPRRDSQRRTEPSRWPARRTRRSDLVRSLLGRLPAGTWELVTHPGYNDADLARVHTRLRASRDVERMALAATKEFPAVKLVSFAELSGQAE